MKPLPPLGSCQSWLDRGKPGRGLGRVHFSRIQIKGLFGKICELIPALLVSIHILYFLSYPQDGR